MNCIPSRKIIRYLKKRARKFLTKIPNEKVKLDSYKKFDSTINMDKQMSGNIFSEAYEWQQKTQESFGKYLSLDASDNLSYNSVETPTRDQYRQHYETPIAPCPNIEDIKKASLYPHGNLCDDIWMVEKGELISQKENQHQLPPFSTFYEQRFDNNCWSNNQKSQFPRQHYTSENISAEEIQNPFLPSFYKFLDDILMSDSSDINNKNNIPFPRQQHKLRENTSGNSIDCCVTRSNESCETSRNLMDQTTILQTSFNLKSSKEVAFNQPGNRSPLPLTAHDFDVFENGMSTAFCSPENANCFDKNIRMMNFNRENQYQQMRNDFASNGADVDFPFTPNKANCSTPFTNRKALSENDNNIMYFSPKEQGIKTTYRKFNANENKTKQKKPLGNFCVFCKNNNEHEALYNSHTVKDAKGRTLCPQLRTHECEICGLDGDEAHTVKYCPRKKIYTQQDTENWENQRRKRVITGNYYKIKSSEKEFRFFK